MHVEASPFCIASVTRHIYPFSVHKALVIHLQAKSTSMYETFLK